MTLARTSRDWLQANRWLAATVLGAIAVVVVLALGAVRIRGVAVDLRDAHDALLTAEQDAREGRLLTARGSLTKAERLVARANGTLHTSPELSAARLVPVVRQNIDALRRSVALALTLTNGGRSILDAAKPLEGPGGRLDVSLRGGTVPIDAVREVNAALKEVAFQLPDASTERSRWLVGPVGDLENDVLEEAAERRGQFISVGRSLDVVTELAGGNGPRRYLIAVANAAEMRGTGGMILSYGEFVSDAGKVALERFGPIDDLALRGTPPGEPLPYPDRYAGYLPLTTWRNTNLTPDFTVVAPAQEDLYTDATGKSVNGVLQVDSFGLAALLRITGPVSIPDAPPITADNVVPFTLNENYFRISDRPERQEVQGEVARAVFQRLVTGDFPTIRDLGTVVADAAAGRHVILHSTSPAVQRTIALLGADGRLPEPGDDVALLTVQNFSGNKLDYYLDTSMTVSGSRPAGGLGRVTIEIDIANTAPRDGRGIAVFGPVRPGFAPGEYRGLVSVYLPLGTHIRGTRGSATLTPVSTQTELNREVATYGLSVGAGGRHSVTLEVTLPTRAEEYRLQVVPVPRVRPTAISMDLDLAPGRLQRKVPMSRPASFGPE